MIYEDIEEAAKEILLEPFGESEEERLDIPESVALWRTRVLLGMIDAPYRFEQLMRQRAADRLSELARSSVPVYEVVQGGAVGYVETLRGYDASPWNPNVINVLANGPCCPELRDFLMGLIEKHPGMAEKDVRVALATINAGLEQLSRVESSGAGGNGPP